MLVMEYIYFCQKQTARSGTGMLDNNGGGEFRSDCEGEK